MGTIKDEEEEWDRKRGRTLMVFSLIFFVNGITLTIYQPTEFFYFRDTMQQKRADVYFGVSQGIMFGSGLIFSFIANLFASRIKRVKLNFMCVDVLSVFGNFLYVMHYHPAFVLLGQFFIGAGALRHVLAVSELTRIYDVKDVSGKTALLTLFTMLGGALGPCCTFACKSIKTQVGWWILDVNAMPGVIIGSLSIITFFVDLFFLNDLSWKKEKMETLLDKPLEDEEEGKLKVNELSNTSEVVTVLLNNPMVSGLYLITFLGFFARTWLILLTPIKSSQSPLNWIQFDVAEVFLVSILAGSIPTTIFTILFIKRLNDIDVLIFSVFTLLTGLVLLMCFPYVKDKTAATAIMYLVNVFAISSGAAANIAVRNMLTRMVVPDIKGLSEALYNRLYDGSKMTAGLMVIVPVISLEIGLIPLIVFCVLEFVWIVWTREENQKMKQIQIPVSSLLK